MVYFTSRSSLPTHQLSGPRFLKFPAPWIHPCQKLSNILASTATFCIFSDHASRPPPKASKTLAHLTVKCWAIEPTHPPCISMGSQTRGLKKKWGYSPCLILCTGLFPNTNHKELIGGEVTLLGLLAPAGMRNSRIYLVCLYSQTLAP